VNINVRKPLSKIIIPVLDKEMASRIEAVRALIMNEVNIKDIELITDTTGIITKRIKPNFKTLGAKCGKYMKQVAALVASFSQEQIAAVESNAETILKVEDMEFVTTAADFEITSEDMPGWLVASEGKLTVALDITITEELKREGVARELVNRIQNIRKESGFEVTDKIRVEIESTELTAPAIESFADYIGQQTLAVDVKAVAAPQGAFVVDSEIDEAPLKIAVTKA
jgi:isoleucyl-tRNA synthetase